MSLAAPQSGEGAVAERRMRAPRRPSPVFSESYETLRGVLRAARRASGLSQRDLAARIGKHPSHVAMIESGQRRLDALELYRIAQVLEPRRPMDLLIRIGERLRAADLTDGA